MNKNKTITIIIALIIILGIIITLTKGFNVEMIAKKHNQIEFDLGKEFNIEDIKTITDEIFENETVEIQKVEAYEEQVLISTKKITDEQKNNLITKINEKYGTELKAEEIEVEKVPKTKLRDYITPHIWEFVLATILVVIYVSIRYKKLSILKVIIQTILGIVIFELLAFSIVAITRIPVGSNLITIAFVVYVISLLGVTSMFEKRLQNLKLQEAKKDNLFK